MISNSGYEPHSSAPAADPHSFFPLLPVASFLLFSLATWANAAVPLADIARGEAADRLTRPQILSLFRGYASLGMRAEAAAVLEKRVHLGDIPPEEAAPLFEEIVVEQSRGNDAGKLLSVCETALRAGARTPMVLYSYGTGLRMAGRQGDGSDILAQIGAESPLHPYALYAIGQIAAERGDVDAASDIFRRVREMVEGREGGEPLARRALRSQAELLLTRGRPEEAASIYEALARKGRDPLDLVGRAASRTGKVADEGGPPPDAVAAWPARQRVLLSLLQGGLARERGQFSSAADRLARAEQELRSSPLPAAAGVSESPERGSGGETLRLLIENHRSQRQNLSSVMSVADPAVLRESVVELLLGLLFMDHAIYSAKGALPAGPPIPEAAPLSQREIEEIFQRIEQAALDGLEVDRLVEDLAAKLDTLQNLAHPLQRYRLLTSLEKSQGEIHEIKERIRQRRETALTEMERKNRTAVTGLLKDLGRFLEELTAIRVASGEIREFTRRHFSLLRRDMEEEKASTEAHLRRIREALAFDNERFAALLPSVRAFEERERTALRERKAQELLDLGPVVRRQLADALVARARFLRKNPSEGGGRESLAAVEKAASYLSGAQLSARDRRECALQIGSFLAEGDGLWEPFPGRLAGEKETAMIAALLPVLTEGADGWERREEGLYLAAVLRMRVRDKDAASAARDFLARFPSSPLAGDIAIRLGHESLLSGKEAEATAFYRIAAEGANPESMAVGRYMLGWARFQNGDPEGAAGELTRPLSLSSFRCNGPSSFEEAVLTLAVRAWKEIPLERLSAYGPVESGSCGGKRLLVSLGESEERRGEAARAARVYDVLSRRFSGGEAAWIYEKKSVEEFLRAGKWEEALSRALSLAGKYGPGSAWAESRSLSVREKARMDLMGMLKSLSERMFDEGIRSGERPTMAGAAAGIKKYFALEGGDDSTSEGSLQLKWAIASLASGDRKTGQALLLEILGYQEGDAVGEKAAILYAETMIAGFERKEETAEDAEDAAVLLLSNFPSEKAATLAYRAAAAFLGAREYERAARTAGEVETCWAAPRNLLQEARLIQAEASLSMNDLDAGRNRASGILKDTPTESETGVRERARDLYLLSSLKEVEARTARREWIGAAKMLEETGERFPDSAETSDYFLRAVRLYRLGEDVNGVLRVGLLFLRKFPDRPESVEVAGILGPCLEEREEYGRAADLYAGVAERFPKSVQAPLFLFRAARLFGDHGRPDAARKRFSSYRSKYSNPRWMNAYASLSVGLLS